MFKKLFCKHEYIRLIETETSRGYPIIGYACPNCGKVKVITNLMYLEENDVNKIRIETQSKVNKLIRESNG